METLKLILRPLTALLALLIVLAGLAVGVGRLRTTPLLTYESNRTGDIDLYAYDLTYAISHNLTRSPAGDTDAAWSPDGEKLAFFSWRGGARQLYLLTLTPPRVTRLLPDEVAGDHPVWSPDGTQLVYERDAGDAGTQLYLLDLSAPRIEGSNPRQLAAEVSVSNSPMWSPDGETILFMGFARQTADAEIFTVHPDGTHLVNLTNDPGWDVSPAWSPDGTEITFFSLRDRTNLELLLMDQAGGNLRRITTSTSAAMNNIAWARTLWSPDGRSVSRLVPTDSGARVEVWSAAGSGLWQSPYESRILKLDLWLPSGLLFTEVYNYSTFRIMEITPNGDPRILIQDGSYPVWWR
ncbi:MAG: PD40 domain-containing protein [Anaerolineae bacterium]|nr:PD40 domain-containing protein [Anaerolineae bacterium]